MRAPGRRLSADLEIDEGEQLLEQIRSVSGERGETCPWWSARDPFVSVVRADYRHWCKGELGAMWGGAIPEALRRGIEIYDSAISAIQAHDMRQPPKGARESTSSGVEVRREPLAFARPRRR